MYCFGLQEDADAEDDVTFEEDNLDNSDLGRELLEE